MSSFDQAPAASRARRVIALSKTPAKLGVAPDDPNANSVTCHVCGEKGHCAGFRGALYIDCVNYACYLCKQQGHTTSTCPYRVLVGGGASVSSRGDNLTRAFRTRELGEGVPMSQLGSQHHYGASDRWRVSAAVLRLHTRRVSVLSFHPARHELLLSADKSGELGVWDITSRSNRSVFSPHKWLINGLSWIASAPNGPVSAAADGTVRMIDLERKDASDTLLDLNPGGWTGNETTWRMLYALSTDYSGTMPTIAGDDVGRLWGLDHRSRRPVLGSVQGLPKGNKVQSLHHNPYMPCALLSAGNDWAVQLWDIRTLSWARNTAQFIDKERDLHASSSSAAFTPSASSPKLGPGEDGAESSGGDGAVLAISKSAKNGAVAVLKHPRVVNSAYWSPCSGAKFMSTCIDNRIRVWDNLNGDLTQPSREIVHSHDFGRYLSPFRAVWDPKDSRERFAVCGRYISEAFSVDGGDSLVPLHPVDILRVDRQRDNPSAVVKQLIDPILSTISPVVAVHPTLDIIACGSSRSLYLFSTGRGRSRGPLGPAHRRSEECGSEAGGGDSGGDGDDSDSDSEDGRGDAAASRRPPASSSAAASSQRRRGGKFTGGGVSNQRDKPVMIVGASDDAGAGGDEEGDASDGEQGGFGAKRGGSGKAKAGGSSRSGSKGGGGGGKKGESGKRKRGGSGK